MKRLSLGILAFVGLLACSVDVRAAAIRQA